MRRRYSPFKIIFIIVPVILIIAGVILFPRFFGSKTESNSSNSSTSSNSTSVRASAELNKQFEFPISADKNKKIKFVVEKAELLDEIIVKGQKATAVSGRTFLIVNLKIINDMDNALNMNTRDYVRLSVNGAKEELLAPDIHNDPVEIQAISTKYTRVGFPVNTTDKDFVLQIGEIKGDKEAVELPFNK